MSAGSSCGCPRFPALSSVTLVGGSRAACARDAPGMVRGPDGAKGTEGRTPVLGIVGGQGGDCCCSEGNRVVISLSPPEPQSCAHFLCQDPRPTLLHGGTISRGHAHLDGRHCHWGRGLYPVHELRAVLCTPDPPAAWTSEHPKQQGAPERTTVPASCQGLCTARAWTCTGRSWVVLSVACLGKGKSGFFFYVDFLETLLEQYQSAEM